LAKFEHATHLVSATKSFLSSTLFPQEEPLRPYLLSTFTVFILEVSTHPLSAVHEAEEPSLTLITRRVDLTTLVSDLEAEAFASPDSRRVVAGFGLFFPNYLAFLTKPEFYVEDRYIQRRDVLRAGARVLYLAKLLSTCAGVNLSPHVSTPVVGTTTPRQHRQELEHRELLWQWGKDTPVGGCSGST
ncbi:hypothetical protein Taro_017626, partial [Colocasia esculenta]|nr:hypothetical protein [Colocasia esculenta]